MEPSPLFATTSRLKSEIEAARDSAAKILGVSPGRLLSAAAIDAIIEARPTTELSLRGVKGVGLRAAAVLSRDVARIFKGGTVAVPDPEGYAEPYVIEGEEIEDVSVSVSAYLRQLNDVLGEQRALVRGEVTEAREYPSGIYFSVKDATGSDAILNCYLPPYRVRAFAHLVTHGAELRLLGVPRIAGRKGSFSFQVEGIEAVGEGALRAAYEKLKRELEAEGLFARALPLPLCARRIGVVTSRAGAVIGDFRKNLESRGYQVLMHDARVEGARAVPSILGALSWFRRNSELVDVVVVMRGGGSLEDLQAFNSEAVARAVAGIPVPVIAAIGHDRDLPIANLAADHETSTPSIAAMLINQTWAPADSAATLGAERIRRAAGQFVQRLESRVSLQSERLASRSRLILQKVRERIGHASYRLGVELAEYATYTSDLMNKLVHGFELSTSKVSSRVLALERELAIVDPQRTLRLGYSILTDSSGKTVKSTADVREGTKVRARVADGTIGATVTDTTHEEPR